MGQIRVRGLNIYGTYGTARTVAGLFALCGWALVVIGILIVVVGLGVGAPFNIMAGGTGVAIAAMGLLQVAAEQILRAAVDMADYSRQSLLLQIAVAEGRKQVDLGEQDGDAGEGGEADSKPELSEADKEALRIAMEGRGIR
jgi:hypothetical protein